MRRTNKSSIWCRYQRPAYLLGVVLSVFLSSIVFVTSATAVISVSQSYRSASSLPIGSLVSLKKDSADEVESSTTTNANNLLGIIISPDSSLLTITSESKNEVQVATSGTTPIIVSDVNGKIEQNDHITASPIAGVGMKATTNVRIIGIAQGTMTLAKENKQEYTDKNGQKHTVQLGQVPVLINVSYFFKQPDKTIIPVAVQNIANSLAGRQVSTLPILISGGIFLVTLIVVMSIIYSMIRSSIISVGRNPMSQSAIYRDLVQLSALVLVILTLGMISIYLVLTKM